MEIWPNEVCDKFLGYHEILEVLVVGPDLY